MTDQAVQEITGPVKRHPVADYYGFMRITYSPDDPAAVYRLCNKHGVVIYVGYSHDPKARIQSHRHSHTWRKEIATWTWTWYPNRAAAMAAETAAIELMRPCYNTVGMSRVLAHAVESGRDAGRINKQITINMTEVLRDELRDCAKRLNVSFSEVVRFLIVEALDKRDPGHPLHE